MASKRQASMTNFFVLKPPEVKKTRLPNNETPEPQDSSSKFCPTAASLSSHDATQDKATSSEVKERQANATTSEVKEITSKAPACVQIKTVMGWKTDFPWLGFTTGNGLVVTIFCEVCKEFPDVFLASCKANLINDGRAMLNGTSNVKKYTCVKHNNSEGHKNASKALNVKKLREQNLDAPIEKGLKKMDSNDIERMIKLFEISYLIAKEEFAFTKFDVLINIEKRHGVDLGNSYSNDKAVRVFIEHIAGSMLDDLKLIIQKSVYFSVLFDGSTDASDSEKELVYIITLDKGVP